MKKTFFTLFIAVSVILFAGFKLNRDVMPGGSSSDSIEIPKEVKAVLDKSCYGCHNSESQNEDAREDLSFDKLGDLSKFKLNAIMGEIVEVVDEGEMPPQKILKKYPEMKLSKKEKEVLIKWARANTAVAEEE